MNNSAFYLPKFAKNQSDKSRDKYNFSKKQKLEERPSLLPELETLLLEDSANYLKEEEEERSMWFAFFANSYSRRQSLNEEYMKKRRFCIDFMFDWALRVKSQHNIPRKVL